MEPSLAGSSLTFRHGVHPAEYKEATESLPIRRMPFVDEYVLPLSQHTGAPSRPLVSVGQRVERGQMIAAPGGFISTALHAPVTGVVRAIELRPNAGGTPAPAIVIRIDPFSSQRYIKTDPPPDEDGPDDEVVSRVQQSGIVGLGGAAFPSHVKLKAPEGKRIRFVVLNGCECEPYLTCDHRVMLEYPKEVLRGHEIIMKRVGAERGYVGIEVNKPDAIETLRAHAKKRDNIQVVPLQVKYPEGAEKMLVDAILSRRIPPGKLPLDVEVVVNNVGTAVAMAEFFATGKPLIERVLTVTGDAVRRPANLLAPIGTPLEDILAYCEALHSETRQVILGGPMMGMAQKRLDVPLVKGASGILVFEKPVPVAKEVPCIRCGRCLEACPMFLNPSRITMLVRAERAEELAHHHIRDCFECASCAFACPSNIPLVQLMRVGKALLRQHEASS